jgi:hypothetical protein
MMNRDMKMLHDREQAEKRCVDLLRQYPELAQEAGNRLLDSLLESWAECECPFHEFIYHVGWLGCVRVRELNVERYKIENSENNEDGGECSGVPA